MGDGFVPRNSAQVKPPRPDKPGIRLLSPDQARRLVEPAYATGNRYAALYVLALHAGLR